MMITNWIRNKPYGLFLAGWLIPGLGHYMMGRKIRGMLFFGCVLALLVMGLIMNGGFWTLNELKMLKVLGFLGGFGNGLLYVISRLAGLGNGDLYSITFHYGTLYITTAGFLNLLIARNAFDMAQQKVQSNTSKGGNTDDF